MPEWLVRLEGEKFDLEDLPSLLCSPENTVIEEDSSYYLKSSQFKSLGSADEVRERAIDMIEKLNGAVKRQNRGGHPVPPLFVESLTPRMLN
jgi:hypothetical protein